MTDAPNSGPDEQQGSNGGRALLASLAAIAAGDAGSEEVVASLRRQGVDALDVLIALFADSKRLPRASGERIDVQNFTSRSAPPAPPKPLRASTRPLLVRGTLYDPADISLFDETELHFVYTGEEHLLAIDDRSVMENWWQTSYLTSAARASATPAVAGNAFLGPDGRPGIGPTGHGGPPKEPQICGHWETVPAPAPVEHTNFYEHPNFEGDRLELRASQGAMSNLLNEPKGIFGHDDWNDKIDTVQMVRTEVTVLYEHVNFQGRSWTTCQTVGQVDWFNDLTSSVRTWGSTPWYGTMQRFVQRPCYPGEQGQF